MLCVSIHLILIEASCDYYKIITFMGVYLSVCNIPSPLSSPDHPGFQYSPDRNKRSPHTKEGPSPRRVRRKSGKEHRKYRDRKKAL